MANESTKWLYEQLKSKGYNVGKDVNEFDTLMQTNAESRQWAYDTATKSGLNVGKDINEFSTLVGGASNETTTSTPDPTPQTPAEPKQEPWKPTLQERIAMQHEAQQRVNDFKDYSQRVVDNTRRNAQRMTQEGRDRAKAGEMLARMNGTPTRLMGLTPPSGNGGDSPTPTLPAMGGSNHNSPIPYGVKIEDGQKKTEWLMPDGSLTTDLAEADRAEYGARAARLQYEFIKRMNANGLDPANAEDVEEQRKKDLLDTKQKQVEIMLGENEEAIRSHYDKKAAEYDERNGWNDDEGFWANFVRIVGGAANRSVSANVPKAEQSLTEDDRTIRNRMAENYVLTEARNLLETRKLKKSNGFMGGFWKIGNNVRNMSMGAKHALHDIDLYAGGIMSLQKATQLLDIEDKLKQGQQLTDSELSLVYATMLNQEVSHNIETPHGYNAAQITVEMFPFMAQMMLNPASGLSRALVTKYGKSGLKKIALTVAGDVAESAVLANTLQGASTAADAIERYQGEVVEGKDGIEFDGSHDWASAIGKAEGAAIIENYTEMLGEHFGAIKDFAGKWIGKGMSKLGGQKIVDGATDLITRYRTSDFGKAIGNLESRAHWNGTVGEVLEEEAGIVLNSMFVGDNSLSDLVDADQQIDIVLGVGLFGGFVSGVKTIGYPIARAKAKSDLRRQDGIGGWRYGEEWGGIREAIETAEESDLSDVVADLIKENAKTSEQAQTIVKYAHALMRARGYDIAAASRAAEGETTPEEQDVEESFDHGSEIAGSGDAQAMNDAKRLMELQRARLASTLSEDMVEEYDRDPIGALSNTIEEDTRRIAADYVNAKQVYDGMVQRVRDDIEGRIAQSDAMVDSRVSRTTGKIQPATMKVDDRQVYIVDGTVAMTEDGTMVDASNSDESVIIRDAETGKIEFADPAQILTAEAAIEPEEGKEAAREAIRMEMAQEAADKIDGVAHFNPGDTLTIPDIDGNPAEITVVGQTVDENGMAIEGYADVQYGDGTIYSYPTELLQNQVDEMNQRRVEDFIAEQEADETIAETDEIVPENGETAGIEGQNSENITESVPKTENTPTEDGFIPIDPNLIPEAQTTTEAQPTATEQMPKDEQGYPLIDEAEPELAWDYIVEQSEGDEQIAAEVAADEVADREKALKDAEKELKKAEEAKPEVKKGEAAPTLEDKIKAKREKKAKVESAQTEVDRAKAALDHWQKIAGTTQRRKAAAEDERRRETQRLAEERRKEEERAKAEREEAERQEREALNGVPDMSRDTPQDARARGYRRNGPEKIDRQEPIPAVMGKEVEVKFGEKELPKGHAAIIDASTLQPSHIHGSRNPLHFLDEAQPKERTDAPSREAARKIAGNIRPEEITSSVTAYTGAPTVNMRGETIQGNSRSDALRLMYETQPEQAAKYRQYLLDHAAEFGLTPEQIASVENPVLVNMLDVEDAEAIRLGQFVAQDTESGGAERIKPKNAVQKMGGKIRSFANILLRSGDEEASLSQLIEANGVETLKWMSRNGYITDTQYGSAFDSKGELSAKATEDLKGILYQSVFTGGSTRLEEMFNKMPAKAQRAILATAFRDYDSPRSDRMVEEIQQSVIVYTDMMNYPALAASTNLKEANAAVEAWKNQYAIDEVTGEPYLPSKDFSNFALKLAALYKGGSQKLIQQTFTDLYDTIQGTAQDTLFEEADKTPKTLGEAIRKVFDMEYEPIKPRENESDRSDVLDEHIAESEAGGLRGDGTSGIRERTEGAEQPAERGGGTATDSRQGNLNVGEAPTTGSRVAEAEASMNQNPTEGQKKAGNYKKGHVAIGDFNITIENPAGSVRRGVDSNGKAWETTMANSYGYIRGTESADGDHIDMFLAESMDEWDGRKVYVVDQTKEDGSFDEHKVMLGFNDGYDALQAYLANYDPTWREKHPGLRISEANIDDFKKWTESSKRKTKAFADYRMNRAEALTLPQKADAEKEEEKIQTSDNKSNAEIAEEINLPSFVGKRYEWNGKTITLDRLTMQGDTPCIEGTADGEKSVFLPNYIAKAIEKGWWKEKNATNTTSDYTPIGKGDFGPIFDQFKGNTQEAIKVLTELQDGEATGALHHEEVGDIDLVWGKAGTGKSDGYGLAKLVKFHPEVVEHLQEILNDMHVTSRTENRIQLESETHKASVRLTWNNEKKKWLLTAFEKKETSEPIDKTTDTDENPKDLRGDTTLSQNSNVSEGKDNALSEEKQKAEGESSALSIEEALKARPLDKWAGAYIRFDEAVHGIVSVEILSVFKSPKGREYDYISYLQNGVEKARRFDPLGHAGFDPQGKIILTM